MAGFLTFYSTVLWTWDTAFNPQAWSWGLPGRKIERDCKLNKQIQFEM